MEYNLELPRVVGEVPANSCYYLFLDNYSGLYKLVQFTIDVANGIVSFIGVGGDNVIRAIPQEGVGQS